MAGDRPVHLAAHAAPPWRALVALLAVLGAAGCSDSDSRRPEPTATPTPALVTISGSCALPGRGVHGLAACTAGTPVTAWRCDRRDGCLHRQGLTLLASTATDGDGAWSLPIPTAAAHATLVVEAEVAAGVAYRALVLDPLAAGGLRALTTAPTIAVVPITPVSEASIRLLDTYGFENYSDHEAALVIAAVENATATLSFAASSPAEAPELAVSTAGADPTVISALQGAGKTPTPTAPPACCDCGGGCFADTGAGCGDCTAVSDAACVDAGCVAFTPTATPTATTTASATATATATPTAPPPCCDCGGGCFQDTGAGCGDCVAIADAVCGDAACVAFTATPTTSPTPSATGTTTATATRTATPRPSASATATRTATITPTPSLTATGTITSTTTATPTVTTTGTPTATVTVTPTATSATACAPGSCAANAECACDTHTALFAIAHAYNDPLATVLYRVRVGTWSTGTRWGDGTNGFFYLATVTGNTPASYTYVPFNGMAVDGNGNPALPPFSFIVPADVSAGAAATTITISACASNQVGTLVTNDCGEQVYQPSCTTVLWSDTYGPVTLPAVGQAPTALVETSLEFSGASTLSIQNTGVYPGVLTLSPQTALSSNDETWLYDHLVFFDANGDPYTNDIFDDCSHPSIGVLTIDEAAWAVPGQASYRTKYGSTTVLAAATAPDRQFFFYTWDRQQTTAIEVGAQFIYDYSSSCPGWINGGPGSIASTCDPFAAGAEIGGPAGLPNIAPYAQISPVDTQGVFTTSTSAQAGTQEVRNIAISAEQGVGLCAFALNPLAINDGDSAYNPPDYVIDDSSGDWAAFPQGLSYIVPSGFGTCGSAAPFCTAASDYVAYVPQYADTDGTFGTRNGGSTDQPLIGSVALADEYALGDIATSTSNTLLWFDNCGYGHTYEESAATNPTLGTRKQLPKPPNDGTTYQYEIANALSFPIVFGKECCASWFQENTAVTPNAWEPPVQIDDGYGAVIAPSQSLAYETLFSDEAIIVYDAGTGAALFKLRLHQADSALYACDADDWSVSVDGSVPYTVTIGAAGAYPVGCGTVGACPFGMTAATDGVSVTCTATESSFLLGLAEWATAIAPAVDSVQLLAWGAQGADSTSSGGAGGFALTVVPPSALDTNLYAYVGSSAGASSILIDQPLSLVTSDVAAVTTDPSSIGALLIAGGGGSSGAGLDAGGAGGAGGVAIANADPSGASVSTAGSDGHSSGASGGSGGNSTGSGDGGSLDGTAGVGGFASGTGWSSGSLIPPQSWQAGYGAPGESDCDYTGGKGGGGFGGGGHGHADCSGSGGGGGGGSWAAANGAYASSATTSAPSSPGGMNGAIQIIYTPAAACTVTESSIACTLPTTTAVADLDGIVAAATTAAAIVGKTVTIGADTPMWIRAWGGAGGSNGGTQAGGAQGLAQTLISIADLEATWGTSALYYYVGSAGDGSHEAGKGGASTLVAAADLSSVTPCLPDSGCTANVLLIAGGGGGGGSGSAGGAGGQAIATTDGDASKPGAGSDDAGGGGDGDGGSDGGAGSGGSAGADGIGGLGGPVHTGSGPSTSDGWLNATPATIGSAGAGGEGKHDSNSDYIGGGGGGGWGGGGGGGAGGSEGHGGGGGGSFAVAATVSGSVPSGSPATGDGAVEIGFLVTVE